MYAKGCYWCWWASSLLGAISSVEVGDKSRSSCCKAWLPESCWQGFHSISPAHPVDHLDRWSPGLLIIWWWCLHTQLTTWPTCYKPRTIQPSLYQFKSLLVPPHVWHSSNASHIHTKNFSLVVSDSVIHITVSAFYSLGAPANLETYLRSFLSRFLIILRVNSWRLFIKEKVMASISGEAQQRLQSFSHWGYTWCDTCDTWYTCDRCEAENK